MDFPKLSKNVNSIISYESHVQAAGGAYFLTKSETHGAYRGGAYKKAYRFKFYFDSTDDFH